MSSPAVVDFLSTVSADSALQAELATLVKSDDDRTGQNVVEFAKDKGYTFSVQEFEAELERRQKDFAARQEAGELTDEELRP